MKSNVDEISNSIKTSIQNMLEFREEISDEKLEEIIAQEVSDYSKSNHLSIDERVEIGRKVLHAMRRLDILQEILDDPEVTEVMVNGYKTIFVEKAGSLTRIDRRFESEDRLKDIIQQIVASCNRSVNE